MKTALDYLKESIEDTNIPEQWYEIEIAEMMDWYADYYHKEQLNIYGVSNCFHIYYFILEINGIVSQSRSGFDFER